MNTILRKFDDHFSLIINGSVAQYFVLTFDEAELLLHRMEIHLKDDRLFPFNYVIDEIDVSLDQNTFTVILDGLQEWFYSECVEPMSISEFREEARKANDELDDIEQKVFDDEFDGYAVYISDLDDDLVQIEIMLMPKERFLLSVKEAGDHLYWVSESLRKMPGKPYVLTANRNSVPLDYKTAHNLYIALKEWSTQFYDEIAEIIENDINNFKLN